MKQTMHIFFKVFAIIFHLVQALISDSAELYFSFTVAVILVGIYVFDIRTFKKLFLVPQWAVSCVGSVVWLVVAVIEIPIDQ